MIGKCLKCGTLVDSETICPKCGAEIEYVKECAFQDYERNQVVEWTKTIFSTITEISFFDDPVKMEKNIYNEMLTINKEFFDNYGDSARKDFLNTLEGNNLTRIFMESSRFMSEGVKKSLFGIKADPVWAKSFLKKVEKYYNSLLIEFNY